MGSVRDLLTRSPVTVSAPCRVDTGGTWDIKALALPLERKTPVTVNMALTLRTTVNLYPYEDGQVKISSSGFSHTESASSKRLPFDSPFGLFFAAVSYFGFHGLEIKIDSQSPVKSALGGSSTALVALLGALQQVGSFHKQKALSRSDVLHLAYHLEDGISGGNCGIQDQAAAVYGGVHQWKWHFGNPSQPLTRISLLDKKGQTSLSKHMLVAYSGKSHVAAQTNRKWVTDFLSGKTRFGWIKANDSVNSFAKAIQVKNWGKAASCLREEMAIRREITPEALDPVTEKMISLAEEAGCGGRFAGAGAGGSVWALGEEININALKHPWQELLKPIKTARILDTGIDAEGMRLEG
jgi:D-glycero-alpha-D-manno-heptose-7-phosphate kinase